jgi:hypothetical protein
VTISLDDLKAAVEQTRKPPKELGQMWTLTDMTAHTGLRRDTLRKKLKQFKVRAWQKHHNREIYYCAADVVKAFKQEGKI